MRILKVLLGFLLVGGLACPIGAQAAPLDWAIPSDVPAVDEAISNTSPPCIYKGPNAKTVCPNTKFGTYGTDTDLSGIDLSEADLSGSFFVRVELSNHDIVSDFKGANLSRSLFREVFVRKANMRGAILDGIKTLTETQARELDSRWSSRATPSVEDEAVSGGSALASDSSKSSRVADTADPAIALFMENVDLAGASLKNIDAFGGGIILDGANLEGVNLAGSRFSRSGFCHAQLQGASLQDVAIRQSYLHQARLDRANLKNAAITESDARGAQFDYADLTGANLADTALTYTETDQTPQRLVPEFNRLLTHSTASFRFANLTNADLSSNASRKLQLVIGNNFQQGGSTFQLGAVGVDFSHANMTNAKLAGTDMNWARLYAANMTNLSSGADLSGATYMPYQPMTAGSEHSCALSLRGTVSCWGGNEFGQLGYNRKNGSPVPVQVDNGAGEPFANVIAVTAGDHHSCSLTTAGHVYCWGANRLGELGDGTSTPSFVPTPVSSFDGRQQLASVRAISAGGSHTCALTTAGQVYCWGANRDGQLGIRATDDHHTVPVQVVDADGGSLANVVAVSAGGGHSCALTSAGHVYCWGNSACGQLGNGGDTNSKIPAQVAKLAGALNGIVAISSGRNHSCALDTSGNVHCWGVNACGQLGNGRNDYPWNIPVQVKDVSGTGTLNNILAISMGVYHSCALNTSGNIHCWGSNYNGQLGNGTNTNSKIPVQVKDAKGTGALNNVIAISTGERHSCALDTSGNVHCWGNNEDGRLGDGSHTTTNIPVLAAHVGAKG